VVLRRPSSVGGTLIPLSLDAEAEALAGVGGVPKLL